MAARRRCTPTTIPTSCPSLRCEARAAICCASRSSCRATRSGSAPGRFRSVVWSSICSTATTPRIRRLSAASPASCMEAARISGCSKSFCWESAAGGVRERSGPGPRSLLSTRGTRPSRCCSGAVNGVSRLHGEVRRRIFQSLFPRWPNVEVPVAHVTNGIHTPSWESPEADALWTKTCGTERWRQTLESIERDAASASDTELWGLRTAARKVLVDYARERTVQQVAVMGLRADEASAMCVGLDPTVLTLGFARRFAAYKRPNLLLHDPARLLRILTNVEQPVQLVIAGKAHPADHGGQELIRAWIQFIRRPDVRHRVIFIAHYDMLLAEHLVRGVDVWVNTPRRPWEASGTSGMKVLVNGGLNLSELDGWWAEAYEPEVGWALGDGQEHGDDPGWDAAEADALYTLLEREAVPAFHTR